MHMFILQILADSSSMMFANFLPGLWFCWFNSRGSAHPCFFSKENLRVCTHADMLSHMRALSAVGSSKSHFNANYKFFVSHEKIPHNFAESINTVPALDCNFREKNIFDGVKVSPRWKSVYLMTFPLIRLRPEVCHVSMIPPWDSVNTVLLPLLAITLVVGNELHKWFMSSPTHTTSHFCGVDVRSPACKRARASVRRPSVRIRITPKADRRSSLHSLPRGPLEIQSTKCCWNPEFYLRRWLRIL